jgi:hypothetical protein
VRWLSGASPYRFSHRYSRFSGVTSSTLVDLCKLRLERRLFSPCSGIGVSRNHAFKLPRASASDDLAQRLRGMAILESL